MNKQPAEYNIDLAEKLWLHCQEQIERTDVSQKHRDFNRKEQVYWEGRFIDAHTKLVPSTSLLQFILV